MVELRTTSRLRRVAAVAILFALLAASCGDDDDGGGDTAGATTAGTATSSPPSSAAAPDEDVDREGTLRVGWDMANFNVDPAMAYSPTDQWIHQLITGTLLKLDAEGNFTPELAEEATIEDPRTISVVLREGLTYHDGTPFTAETVKAGTDRNFASPRRSPTYAVGELANLESIEVTGELTFTIHLKEDVAGSFYPLLARAEFATLSPAATPPGQYPISQPVGAGPYTFTSFSTENGLVLERWPDYFDAEAIRVKTVQVRNVAPAAAVTALRSGDVDYMNVTYGIAQQLGNAVAVDLAVRKGYVGLVYMNCKKFPPVWSDPRAREAISLAIDREAINEAVYGGTGTPMNSFFVDDDPLFDRSLAGANERDLDRAKALLAEAGIAPGQKIEMLVTGDPATTRTGEIIQANLAEIGLELELATSPNLVTEFYVERTRQASLTAGVSWSTIDLATVNMSVGGPGNLCDVGRPAPDGTPPSAEEAQAIDVIAQLRALEPNDPEAAPLWAQLQQLVDQHNWQIWTVAPPTGFAYDDDTVGNPSLIPMWAGFAPDVRTMYVKA